MWRHGCPDTACVLMDVATAMVELTRTEVGAKGLTQSMQLRYGETASSKRAIATCSFNNAEVTWGSGRLAMIF